MGNLLVTLAHEFLAFVLCGSWKKRETEVRAGTCTLAGKHPGKPTKLETGRVRNGTWGTGQFPHMALSRQVVSGPLHRKDVEVPHGRSNVRAPCGFSTSVLTLVHLGTHVLTQQVPASLADQVWDACSATSLLCEPRPHLKWMRSHLAPLLGSLAEKCTKST